MENNKILYTVGAILTLALLLVGIKYLSTYSSDSASLSTENETVVSKENGLSFSYPSGDNGLALIEPPAGINGVKKAYIMMPADEYATYQESNGSEAPAGINIFVLGKAEETASTTTELSRLDELKKWATDNDRLTAFTKAKAEPTVVEIDGLDALYYQADGLYQQEIYLASYKNNVYMFIGQYKNESDRTYLGFKEVIKSVSFD